MTFVTLRGNVFLLQEEFDRLTEILLTSYTVAECSLDRYSVRRFRNFHVNCARCSRGLRNVQCKLWPCSPLRSCHGHHSCEVEILILEKLYDRSGTLQRCFIRRPTWLFNLLTTSLLDFTPHR